MKHMLFPQVVHKNCVQEIMEKMQHYMCATLLMPQSWALSCFVLINTNGKKVTEGMLKFRCAIANTCTMYTYTLRIHSLAQYIHSFFHNITQIW